MFFKKEFNSTLLLLIILVAAALLRLQHLYDPFDSVIGWRETSTAMIAKNFYLKDMNVFFPQVDWGGAGPNYQGREFQTTTYIIALLYHVFGLHEYIGRLVVIIFSIWSLFCFYKLLCLLFDENVAFVATAIWAVMPGAVFLERSLIPDPVMVSLMMTALWLSASFAIYGRTKYFICAMVLATLGVLTKINGFPMLLPAVYLLFLYRKDGVLKSKTRLLYILLPLMFLLVIGSYYLWANHLAEIGTTRHFAGTGKFLTSSTKLKEWLREKYFIDKLAWVMREWMWKLPIIVLAFAGLVLGIAEKRRQRLFFHVWFMALSFQYFIEAEHLLKDPQNLEAFNPVAAGLTGTGLVRLADFFKKLVHTNLRNVAMAMTIICIWLHGRTGEDLYYLSAHSNLRNLGTEMKRLEVANEDLIISFGLNPMPLYYSGLNGWVFPPAYTWTDAVFKDYGTVDINRIQHLQTKGAKWLLISNDNDYTLTADPTLLQEKFPELMAFIATITESTISTPYGTITKLCQAAP